MLNAGHTRRMAFTVRCDGEDHEPRQFSTWAPKAIAMIGRLPDTLEDRAVVVPMRRRAPGDDLERLRLHRLDELEPLRRKAARWTADNLEPLTVADPELPAGLNDRAADNWRPLFAIADRAGGDWPKRARRAAEVLSSGRSDNDGTVGTMLLADLLEIFGDAERMTSADLVAALVEMEHRPWPEWGRQGQPLTKNSLARLLARYHVYPQQVRVAGAKLRGYERSDLEPEWASYLDDHPPSQSTPPAQPVQRYNPRPAWVCRKS